jgi:exonuclease VII small subunit
MKTKNIPPDIKSKSINEAKIEISDILKRLEDSGTDLENSKKDYERLLLLNDHVDNIFKEKLTKIHSIGKKK